MRQETFWVGCVARSDLAEEDIESIIASTITKFRHLPPVNEPEALLKTILVLFPAVTDLTLINEAQRRLKERSIAMGLMIGQFYPGCEEPGVRNPEFKPLQSPLPLLAIRYMVGSDLPFLIAKSAWVEEYLKKFASSIPATARSMIATKFVVPNVEEPDNQGMNH